MEVRVPGDKSISQRALLLSALAQGRSRLRGLSAGGDPVSTASALRALGADIPRPEDWRGEVVVEGLGLRGLRAPEGILDLRNSGTGARLLMGILAGHPFRTTLTGDDSLRSRPMGRVAEPLMAMGAKIRYLGPEGRLPLAVEGGVLRPLEWDLPVASAQVKSALLLAALVGGVGVRLREPGRSRDHTERMLRAVGVDVVESSSVGEWGAAVWEVALRDPPRGLSSLNIAVPGDFSSAAFLMVFGLLAPPGPPLRIKEVGLNPTRTGFLDVIRRMGGRVTVEELRDPGDGELRGDLVVEASALHGCEVSIEEIPRLIDEIPVLAVLASRALGVTTIRGAAELRVKESDRIRAVVSNLRRLDVACEELADGMVIEGTERDLAGRVESFGDHRLAMAFGILEALEGGRVEVVGREVVGVSFPGFWELLDSLTRWRSRVPREAGAPQGGEAGTARTEPWEIGWGVDGESPRPRREGRRPPVITLDGPAGSGKSTTARELARRLGFRHLDSGALYRALTFALVARGIPPEEWAGLSHETLHTLGLEVETVPGGFRLRLGQHVLGEELRSREVTRLVSSLAAMPGVRAWLLERQRAMAEGGGLVADGRDMGTVVFPAAEVKIFLTADLPVRARRRFWEREGREPSPEELREEMDRIRERDLQDEGRREAPLRKAPDAVEVDTSCLAFHEQVECIIKHVKRLTELSGSGSIQS